MKLLSNGVDVHFFEELLYDVSSLQHIAELERGKYSMLVSRRGYEKLSWRFPISLSKIHPL